MVGGFAATTLGLLYLLDSWGMTLDFTAMALRKGHYQSPVATMLLVGVGSFSGPARRTKAALRQVGNTGFHRRLRKSGDGHCRCRGHGIAHLRRTSGECRHRGLGDSDHQRWSIASLVWRRAHRR